MTEQEILIKLTAMCAHAEHCTYEMQQKMQKWNVKEDVAHRIIDYLHKEHYVDDSRYARLFVKDRIKANKWGRRKVEQALFLKHIPKEIATEALDTISDETYIEILRPLLKSKRRTIKASSEYEANGKLIRFALGRGFTIDIIRQCLDDADNNYDSSYVGDKD